MIYFDHASTSFPKPAAVGRAVAQYLETSGNPGRSGHRLARMGEATVQNAREALAEFLGAPESDRIVFTMNATMALNTAVKGLVGPGDRVLTSSFEHNGVTRVCRALEQAGVRWTVVPPGETEPIDLVRLEDELRTGDVSLVVVNHASNVTGAVIPLETVYDRARHHGVPVVVDAAQSAGHIPVSARHADVIVFSGHKELLGPQGTGGMYVSSRVRIRPLMHGGTGGRSESPDQPRWLPYALESGTPNGMGIAGLGAAVRHVLAQDAEANAEREQRLRMSFVEGVSGIAGVELHQWPSSRPAIPLVSLTFAGCSPTDAAALLEERHGVLVRGGLHCAPLAHRTLGTAPSGTVRFSMGSSTTESDVEAAVEAVRDLAKLVQR